MLVAEKIPDCGGVGVPGVTLRIRIVKLVEKAVRIVEDQNVAVAAARIRVAFDGKGRGDRHGARIAFVTVGREIDGNEGLTSAHDGVGNADGRTRILSRAKIGMNRDAGSDEIDNGSRIRIDRSGRDVLIP